MKNLLVEFHAQVHPLEQRPVSSVQSASEQADRVSAPVMGTSSVPVHSREESLERAGVGSPEKACSGTFGKSTKESISLKRLDLALPADIPSSKDPLCKITEGSLPRPNRPMYLKGYPPQHFLLEKTLKYF
jgi:hypothetical protein